MREVKFNFYNTITKEYTRWGDSNASMLMSAFFTHEHLKFLQNTGVKDTNGIEIYEGDIVIIPRWSGTKQYEVIFEHGMFRAVLISEGERFPRISLSTFQGEIGCKLIGNIYKGELITE